MKATERPLGGNRQTLSELYDEALPVVWSYVRARCGSKEVAEEVAAATFVQAAVALGGPNPPTLTVGWLITVARHKLIDHWRHQAVVERSLVVLEGGLSDGTDPWDTVLDQARADQVLAALAPHYRMALTLRYLDDLSVPECADLIGKSVRATESLLVRARAAFRTEYEETGGDQR